MKLVVIESPYAGDITGNISYAKSCVLDSLNRGEAPYASHLLFTQDGILDDSDPDERRWGIEAGLAWGDVANLRAVYVDLGVSEGMRLGIQRARRIGQTIEFRSLEGDEQLVGQLCRTYGVPRSGETEE